MRFLLLFRQLEKICIAIFALFLFVQPSAAFKCEDEGDIDFTHGSIYIRFLDDNSLYRLSDAPNENIFPNKAGTNWLILLPLNGLPKGRMDGGSAGVMFVKRAVKPAGGNYNKRVVYASKQLIIDGRKETTDVIAFKLNKYNSFHEHGGNLPSLINALHLDIFNNKNEVVYKTYEDAELREKLIWDLEGTSDHQKRIYGQRFVRSEANKCYYYTPSVAYIDQAGPIVSEVVEVIVGAQKTRVQFGLSLK